MEKDFVGIYHQVVSDVFCDHIIDKFERVSNTTFYQEGKTGFELDGENVTPGGALGRRDRALFFEHVAKAEAEQIHNQVGKCMDEYIKRYPGLANFNLASYFCKVQRTDPKGGFHHWHSEHNGDMWSMRRIGVWMLYLTDHEGEGETEFIEQGLRITPTKGTVVIWPAGFTHTHRGNPVYEKTKYIATGWFEQQIGEGVLL